MRYLPRVIYWLVGVTVFLIIAYCCRSLWVNSRKPITSTSIIQHQWIDLYSWVRLCDEKLAIYYDQFLLCLKSIPNPELLRIDYAEPSNAVSNCNNQLNREDLLVWCFFQSNYNLIGSTCRMMIWFDEQNEVIRSISQTECIKKYESLVSSWGAAINFRRQFDGSSFIECSSNFDCPHDEFCSIQWVQRCEKIISAYNDDTILVTAVQMEEIIKDKNNKVVWWWDNHSRINSITLDNGARYVARDVSVLWLIDRYYSEEERRTMDLWIE